MLELNAHIAGCLFSHTGPNLYNLLILHFLLTVVHFLLFVIF